MRSKTIPAGNCSSTMGRVARSSRKLRTSSLEMRLRFSPTSRAFRTSCGQNEGAIAVPPRLNIPATCWARAVFSSGKHQVRATEASMTNRLIFDGLRASFVNQIFDFEAAQGKPVALAERRQSLRRFGSGTTLGGDALL